VRYRADAIEVATGTLSDAMSSIRFSGTYRPAGKDWSSGTVTFDAATQNLPANRFQRVAALRPAIEAALTGRIQGSGDVVKGQFAIRSAQADLALDRIRIDKNDIGNLAVGAETRDSQLQVHATGKVRESAVEARGAWRIDGDNPGTASVRFSRL